MSEISAFLALSTHIISCYVMSVDIGSVGSLLCSDPFYFESLSISFVCSVINIDPFSLDEALTTIL